MNYKDAKRAGELIENIAKKKEGGLRYPIMMGKVVNGSVDMDTLTCAVELSIDDEGTAADEEILINAAFESTAGITLIPEANSVVWVAELDGPGGKKGIIKCSNLQSIRIETSADIEIIPGGILSLNGDGYGGIPVTPHVVSTMNMLIDEINRLKAVLAGWVPVPNDGGAALKSALTTEGWPSDIIADVNDSDFENVKVKQG